jgi:hypothetical protein
MALAITFPSLKELLLTWLRSAKHEAITNERRESGKDLKAKRNKQQRMKNRKWQV